jgi:hypothetical protein
LRAGIIQPNYIPWRGYFDFISCCDVFLFSDTVQYTRRDWRNRNKIKFPNGVSWLSVPVKYAPVDTPIHDIEVVEGWADSHRKALSLSFSKSPYHKVAMDLWESGSLASSKLSVIDISLTRVICEFLGINTKTLCASELGISGVKTDLLIDVCRKVGADRYLSGPAAKAYLEEKKMNDAGIEVEWKEYCYPPYEQAWGDFRGDVTVLDLIANTGPRAREYL